MIYIVKNQDNRYLDSKVRAEVIHAVEHDLTYTYVDETKVVIKNHKTDKNGNMEINVCVEY